MYRLLHRILLFYFFEILAHGLVNLGRFRQLLAWNAALFGGVRFHETAVH